jgi:hypothetical protein
MADDPTKTATAETPADKPAEPAKPAPPKDEVIPLAKFKELEDRYANLEASLRALAQPMTQQQRRANPQAADLQDRVSIIAARLNAEPDQVRQWDPFLSTYFEEISRPYITALANMADKLEQIEARSEIPDYGRFAGDIKTERETRIQRGEYLAPREAYHLVRSRRLPEILEEERTKAVAESRSADHVSQQATDAEATTAKAGPSPVKTTTPLSKEAFDKLSIEDKEKALENIGF